MSFKDRFTDAVQDGILVGVKWAIVFALFAAAAFLVAGDYSVVRARALNGQIAFEELQRLSRQQQASAPVAPVAPDKTGPGR